MISVNISVFLLLIFCLSNSNLELKFRYAKFTILHLTALLLVSIKVTLWWVEWLMLLLCNSNGTTDWFVFQIESTIAQAVSEFCNLFAS